VPNSPASSAGLKGLGTDGTINDIIIGADGQPMKSLDDLYRLLDRKQFGESVNLEIFRAGSRVSVPVKLTPLPSSSGRTRRASE
jgi:S1-C subfamily serine protease